MTRIDDQPLFLEWNQTGPEWAACIPPYKITVIGNAWQLWADRVFIANGAVVGGAKETKYRGEDYLRRHLKRLIARMDGAGVIGGTPT